jgi:hypothetical protein
VSKRIQNTNRANSNIRKTTLNAKNTGIVIDVILDDTNKRIEEYDFSEVETKNTGIIGGVVVRTFDDITTATETLKVYLPMIPEDGIPIVNETVQLFTLGSRTYYKRIYDSNLNLGNAALNREKNFVPTKEGENNVDSYSEVSTTKTPKPEGGETEEANFGKYFEPKQVNPLKLYEGDKLIQSRFGQSIRFSGYNNANNTFSPTILIRNRQSRELLEPDVKPGSLIEEDINKDGSTIAITSGEYNIQLSPGSFDDGGAGKIDTLPNSFTNYPSDFSGVDQILINTGRLILSSKTSEMIFLSKGNYGFISDGKFSIDNGSDGAELDFNGEFRMTMNNNPTFILGGGNTGKIFLNTEEESEPIVRGDSLKKVMERLIDEILKLSFATPSGPTQAGPLPPNVGSLNKIKKDLRNILSTTNFTE